MTTSRPSGAITKSRTRSWSGCKNGSPLPFRGGVGGGGILGSERHLVDRARKMRREPTEPEKILWRHLSSRQLGGFKFRRQATLDPFIADFFCPSKGLIVEVDGDTHVTEDDAKRAA